MRHDAANLLSVVEERVAWRYTDFTVFYEGTMYAERDEGYYHLFEVIDTNAQYFTVAVPQIESRESVIEVTLNGELYTFEMFFVSPDSPSFAVYKGSRTDSEE